MRGGGRSRARTLCQRRPVAITPLVERQDITDQEETADRIESTELNEPSESSDRTEPTDPMEHAEPTDPMDRIEPFEPMLNRESSDHSDQRDADVGFEQLRGTTLFLLPAGTSCQKRRRLAPPTGVATPRDPAGRDIHVPFVLPSSMPCFVLGWVRATQLLYGSWLLIGGAFVVTALDTDDLALRFLRAL